MKRAAEEGPGKKKRKVPLTDGPPICLWNGCGQQFADVTELGVHLNLHVNQNRATPQHRIRPPCLWQGCERGVDNPLKSAYNLVHHLRYHHTGEKPFRCPREGCESAFVQQSDLKDHLRKLHGEDDGHVPRQRKQAPPPAPEPPAKPAAPGFTSGFTSSSTFGFSNGFTSGSTFSRGFASSFQPFAPLSNNQEATLPSYTANNGTAQPTPRSQPQLTPSSAPLLSLPLALSGPSTGPFPSPRFQPRATPRDPLATPRNFVITPRSLLAFSDFGLTPRGIPETPRFMPFTFPPDTPKNDMALSFLPVNSTPNFDLTLDPLQNLTLPPTPVNPVPAPLSISQPSAVSSEPPPLPLQTNPQPMPPPAGGPKRPALSVKIANPADRLPPTAKTNLTPLFDWDIMASLEALTPKQQDILISLNTPRSTKDQPPSKPELPLTAPSPGPPPAAATPEQIRFRPASSDIPASPAPPTPEQEAMLAQIREIQKRAFKS
jgi:uncharacterized C2H2 Zn-finger protein